jgi:hypothetical protein
LSTGTKASYSPTSFHDHYCQSTDNKSPKNPINTTGINTNAEDGVVTDEVSLLSAKRLERRHKSIVNDRYSQRESLRGR